MLPQCAPACLGTRLASGTSSSSSEDESLLELLLDELSSASLASAMAPAASLLRPGDAWLAAFAFWASVMPSDSLESDIRAVSQYQ